MINEKRKRAEMRALEEGNYHFCTDGLKGGNLFNCVEEYAFGMILLGLISVKYHLVIYAFTLMPNHVHVILHGTGENCLCAFDFLKRKLRARLKKDGYPQLPEDYWFKLVRTESSKQMKSEILYVLRNALEKGIGMAEGYLWSSGWMYYSDLSEALGSQQHRNPTARERNRWLGGEDAVPEHWRFHPYLGLHPSYFLDTTLVRGLFPEPKDMQTALVKDYESFFQVAGRLGEVVQFNQAEIQSIVGRTLQDRFGAARLNELGEEDKAKLAIILNREYGLGSYQISTSIYVKEAVVRQLLSSKEVKRGII